MLHETHVLHETCVLQRLAISVQYGPGAVPPVVRNRMCGNKYYAGFCCRSHIYVTVSASDTCISRSCTVISISLWPGEDDIYNDYWTLDTGPRTLCS